MSKDVPIDWPVAINATRTHSPSRVGNPACTPPASGAFYLVDDDDPEPRRLFRRSCFILIALGAITWLVGLFIHSLFLLIVGASIAVAAGFGLRADP